MKIRVYGPGCWKCKVLEENTRKALEQLKKTASIEKVTDWEKMVEAGVVMTPALEIDGEIVSSGKVLSPEDIKKLIKG